VSDLGHVLTSLIPVVVGLGFGFSLRFLGVWLGLYEARHSQRIIADALKIKLAAETTPTNPQTPIEASLLRIAAALEAQIEVQKRSRWEQTMNYLAQAAIVIGGVLGLAALLRH
jgi:hypothetical protein